MGIPSVAEGHGLVFLQDMPAPGHGIAVLVLRSTAERHRQRPPASRAMNVRAGAVGGFPKPFSGEKNVLASSFGSRGTVISGPAGFARGTGFRAHPCKSMAAPGSGLPTFKYPGNPG